MSRKQPDTIDLFDRKKDHFNRDPAYRKLIERVKELRPRARRFIFDAEASTHLGHFIRDCGDLIVANRQFAIPPFETTYIQIDIDDMIKAINRRSSTEIYGDPDADRFVGYLIHKQHLYAVTSDDTGEAALSLLSYDLDTPNNGGPIFDEPLHESDPNDEWPRAAVLLGTTINDIPDEADRLRLINSVRINVNAADIDRKHYRMMIYATMGELRNVWAALLLLNQKKHVTAEPVPHRAGIWKGKRHVYASHSVVRIRLGAHETIRKAMLPTMHIPRRRHEVMGHFAHWHLKDGCEHGWPPFPEIGDDGTPRWTCGRCGGLRVWRKYHLRGHGAEGFVTKSYNVTE